MGIILVFILLPLITIFFTCSGSVLALFILKWIFNNYKENSCEYIASATGGTIGVIYLFYSAIKLKELIVLKTRFYDFIYFDIALQSLIIGLLFGMIGYITSLTLRFIAFKLGFKKNNEF